MELTKRLLDLLRIDSVTGDEAAVTEYIDENYRDTLFTCRQSGLNRYYSCGAGSDVPAVSLFGHTDTVTNQQSEPPCEKGDKIFGCGASDMKGGLAVMMNLMDDILDGRKLRYNLNFMFYYSEEGPMRNNGLNHFLKEDTDGLKTDLALVLEPTDNTVQMGCVGSVQSTVHFVGKSGHSARPWEGDNAIVKSWKLLKKLQETSPHEVSFGDLKFYEVYTATLARGGQTSNSVPAEFDINLNYRFAPGKSIENATDDLAAFCDGICDYTIRDCSPAGDVVGNDNLLLNKLIQDNNLKVLPKQAWTDIAQLMNAGIPAVNFGPGSPSQAHQKDEFILTDQLRQNYKILSDFLFLS